jgi:dipeptidyl aminopeptidase/acylaminoacyl peptidase
MRRFSMSPDGERIAFEMVDRAYGDGMFSGFCDLWVMNRDGGGQVLLARDARHPAWNPLRRAAIFERDACSAMGRALLTVPRHRATRTSRRTP